MKKSTKQVSKERKIHLSQIGLNPDDSVSWTQKWKSLNYNASKVGRLCELTFEDYVEMAVESGIFDPNLIGYGVDKYHMSRYMDAGDYTRDNCRFLFYLDNQKERIISGKSGSKLKKKFRIISPEGEVFEGCGLKPICHELGLSFPDMSKVCRGIIKKYKGWKGEYLNV